MRLVGWLTLALATAAAAQPARTRAFAWLGSWEELESPGVDAPPGGSSEREGDLGGVFRVRWQRDGDGLTVTFTTLREAWCGRLGIEMTWPVGTLTVGYHDLPIRIPVDGLKTGQVWWTWSPGVPAWVVAEGLPGAVVFETDNHHGVFLLRRDDGTVALQVAVDRPALGRGARLGFQLVAETSVAELRAARERRLGIEPAPPIDSSAARRLRGTGMVHVDANGSGFVDGHGVPYAALGRNLPHLMAYTPAEQEAQLDEVVGAGMNTVRVLLSSAEFHPVPGAWNDAAFDRLRETVDRCAARGIRAIVCLEYSAAGSQYSTSLHLSRSPADLYLLDEAFAWFEEVVRRVVTPLRDDPAILAWDVTNEPFVDPDPRSEVLAAGFRQWLRERYGAVDRVRESWATPELAGFEAAPMPSQKEYDSQSTAAARDFLAYAQGLLAQRLILRARAVKAADPNHLLTVSGWNPRLLRGHNGAELFDFWAPHTYDLWVNGRLIDDHVGLLAASLRDAVPDRRRPVVIEEFGISPGPRYPDPLRAEHVGQFLAAGQRHGLAGALHWWDMGPALDAAYRRVNWDLAVADGGPEVAVYLPASQEWNLLVYDRYMTRRAWARAVALLRDVGLTPRFVAAPGEAREARALLVLGDRLTADELAALREVAAPVYLLPEAGALGEALPAARRLPGDEGKQGEVWKEILGG